jgi:TPR repeat protein
MKRIRTAAVFGCFGLLLALGQKQDFTDGMKAYEKNDYATAFKVWQPLAEGGSAAAQFNLGLLYYEGQGTPQDFEKATEWFGKSADQGYASAQRNLGELYFSGKSLKRDYVQSYKWFSLCAASGNETCADHRDQVAKKLKGSKLAEAQRLAREWKPKTGS